MIGFSPLSTEIQVKAAQTPDKPTNVANVEAQTSATQIGLTWQAPANDGGSAVTDYQIWYDNASGSTFEMLATSVTSLSYTALGLTQG